MNILKTKERKKISILHLDNDDLNSTFGGGGQAVITNEIYKRFSENYAITILTANYPGAVNKNENEITYKRIGIGNMGPYISLLSFWFFLPFYVAKMQRNFDIVIEFFTAPFSASFTMFVINKPYIVSTTFLGAKELSKKYSLPFNIFEEFALKKIKNFIVPIKEIKDNIKRINPKATIDVVPYGYDTKITKYKQKEGNYALYIGRIDIYNKGLDTLIEAWSRVHNVYPNLKLVIVGSGKKHDEIKLRELISKKKLTRNISLTGRVVGKQKNKLLAECLFFIAPSRFETFCISALEAMSAGKPLIRTDILGMSWIPKDCALAFKLEDSDDLYKQCIKIISNKQLRHKLTMNGKELARKYSWDSIVKKFQSIIFRNINV